MVSSPCDEHEIAFIESFVNRERQARYLELRVRKRVKWLDRLNHYLLHEINQSCVITEESAKQVVNKHRLVDCWLFADSSENDRKCLPIGEAILEIRMADFGIIGSLLPGSLACFRPEAPGEMLWLFRSI